MAESLTETGSSSRTRPLFVPSNFQANYPYPDAQPSSSTTLRSSEVQSAVSDMTNGVLFNSNRFDHEAEDSTSRSADISQTTLSAKKRLTPAEREERRRRKEKRRFLQREFVEIPPYEIAEDGTVLGLIWPYTSNWRYENPFSFAHPFESFDTGPKTIGVYKDELDPPTPTKPARILIPQDGDEDEESETESDDLMEWYEKIDPEVYAMAQAPFAPSDFKKRKFKDMLGLDFSSRRKRTEAKRQKPNHKPQTFAGRILSALWKFGEATLSIITTKIQN